MDESEIQKFYNGCNILITGGTGFMGKILVEKLLRSTEVSTIFLLIREKKGKDIHTRMDEMFDDIVFERLRKQQPKFKHRIVGITGDCCISGLGLTITDRQKLIIDIDIVFHVAATVRFDENIKLAYSINVQGTKDVIELCRQMKHLKSLVHVSTAYSNCHLNEIDEKFYDYPISYEKIGGILEKLTKDESDRLTPSIIGDWPNTYAFTKALAESLIRDIGDGIPLGIFRPAIVVSSYKEPLEGWIDNLYGPTGVCAGAASGLLRVLHCDRNVIADIVPVDTCVAGLIASAWDIAQKQRTTIPIYNYVSSVENPITWGEYTTLNMIHGLNYPLNKCIWTIKFNTISSRKLYLLYRFLLHFLPAFFMDLGALMIGCKPRLLSMYRKIHKFSDVISFFCTREWKFSNKNTILLWKKMNNKDRELFPLSITTVPWLLYFQHYFKGMRVHLIQDPLSTLPNAKSRKRRYDKIHSLLKFFLNSIIVLIIWILFVKISSILTGTITTFNNNNFPNNRSICDFY